LEAFFIALPEPPPGKIPTSINPGTPRRVAGAFPATQDDEVVAAECGQLLGCARGLPCKVRRAAWATEFSNEEYGLLNKMGI